MTKLTNPFSNLDYRSLDWKTVFWILFLVALFVRFPFFFRDYIDRDESTFIIMGQSWVDGHLPYTQLWDLKPPITFLFFAVIIKFFGKSFIAIRLFGSLMVALTALFTYGIATKITSQKIAFWCALFCVFFQSLFGSLQGVMSEHISILFFVAGVYFLFAKNHWAWFFAVGILFGLSVMSKLNMAYPFVFLWLYLGQGFLEKDYKNTLKKLVVLGLGFVFLIALTVVPYYTQNQTNTWWLSIFKAPLAYSGSKQHSIYNVLPFVLVTLSLLIAGFGFKLIDITSKKLQFLSIIIIGILLSFMQAGKVNGHYLIQLYPFILILIGMALGKLPSLQKPLRLITGILLVLIPMESYLEYANIVSNKINKGSFFNGEGIDVPIYITENNLETKNIFFTEYHIGYWVLGATPPTKVSTHPSNITREELFPFMENEQKTSMEELRYILEVLQPKTIVARKGKSIFDGKFTQINEYINDYLLEHYFLIETIDRGLIYKRIH
ncbi:MULTISPECIES: glycosyltransferase family 39 protein [Flavobacteriaceae]|uniref:ArnT family glycosyltransferase n=1 Tax=Flavobacteriaceae TaxID=49546 RepID=UPI00234B9C3C|nr:MULTISPECIES: glycosyltransferase family 39 protein [Allomuricauda]MDC6365383.1 glycosyltransferase family 39 protein [Muricauda sp. AC10]